MTQLEREQKLVDICFELVLVATDPECKKSFDSSTQEQRAAWVAEQLRGCGFNTSPSGFSWGVLENKGTNDG
jgi:hypothetical protein